ncbi:MAG: hypothetical protein ACXVR1_09070, partial [Solirubrobacteraceae bacterium]
ANIRRRTSEAVVPESPVHTEDPADPAALTGRASGAEGRRFKSCRARFMSSSPPPPEPKRGFWRELLEGLRDLGSLGRPCTCGMPGKIGPCPRHGKLS